ncbi:hypothetical protein D3C71_1129810 [compost metagenome]
MNFRNAFKENSRIFNCHFQYVVDGFSFEANFQGFPVVAFSVAGFTFHIHIGKEIHFDDLQTAAAASVATTSRYIERKSSGFVSANLSFGKRRKQGADFGENVGVSCRITSWCSTNRTLIDFYHFIQEFQSFNFLVRHGFFHAVVNVSVQNRVECVVNQSRFSTAGNSGYTSQSSQRNRQINILQVISSCSF